MRHRSSDVPLKALHMLGVVSGGAPHLLRVPADWPLAHALLNEALAELALGGDSGSYGSGREDGVGSGSGGDGVQHIGATDSAEVVMHARNPLRAAVEAAKRSAGRGEGSGDGAGAGVALGNGSEAAPPRAE